MLLLPYKLILQESLQEQLDKATDIDEVDPEAEIPEIEIPEVDLPEEENEGQNRRGRGQQGAR